MSINKGHEVYMASMPDCDVCKLTQKQGPINKATYDAKLGRGSWAYVCDFHFQLNQCKTGIGFGQRLLLRK